MNDAANLAIKIIIQKLIIPRMEERGVKVADLSRTTGISKQSLGRFINMTQDITLSKFIQILTALEINPQFIPTEFDNKEYTYIHLN